MKPDSVHRLRRSIARDHDRRHLAKQHESHDERVKSVGMTDGQKE